MKISDTTNKGFGLLYEMGCGKTLNAIAIAGALYLQGRIGKVLIVAPSSVCSVWSKELDEFADFKVISRVMFGDKRNRLKRLQELKDYKFKALKVAIINYESVWRDDIYDALLEWDPDLVIADESQRIKSHTARQSKAMHHIGDRARYKMILSGTPVQNNAIDLYSQFRFLDSRVFGKNYYQFRNKYAVMGGFNNKQIVAYKNMDQLIKKEHSIAYRVTKADALDLPEQAFLTRYVQLKPAEMKIYKTLKRDSVVELENGSVTATTVLTKLLRLQQLTGGFLQEDDEKKPEFVSDAKSKALEDILDDYVIECGKKLVVFCRFRTEIGLIEELLKKKKIQYGLIYGDIKISDRGDIVKDFQENPDTKVFLAQIDTAGLGITLTAADTCVYYSVNYNYAAYSQSLARIHRIGQKNKCTYIHLVCEDTVDEKVLAALAKKEDLAKTIVDEWRNYF